MDDNYLMKEPTNSRPVGMAHVPMVSMPWPTIYFGSALHGLTGSRSLWQSSSTDRSGGSDRSVPPETAAARSWSPVLGQSNPPTNCSRFAHQHFPKGPRHNQYRNDPGEHHFLSNPSDSSHALCRRGALYLTSHRGSLWDYDLTRPSRLQSNAANIIYRVNRIFSTIAPHCAAPLRCLSRES